MLDSGKLLTIAKPLLARYFSNASLSYFRRGEQFDFDLIAIVINYNIALNSPRIFDRLQSGKKETYLLTNFLNLFEPGVSQPFP
jgi:hypothetical protein